MKITTIAAFKTAYVVLISLLDAVTCFSPIQSSFSKTILPTKSILAAKPTQLYAGSTPETETLTLLNEPRTAIAVDNSLVSADLTSQSVAINNNEINKDNKQGGFSYTDFAKEYPFANNIMIATIKTAAADLLAQTVIGQTPLMEIDLQRSFLFCLFGALYLGGFQYLYQVQIFKRLFDVDKFTSQSWNEKLRDVPGLKALAGQTVLDLSVLTLVYLPTFYIFKASVFSGSPDLNLWISTGLDNYATNFAKDELDLVRVWLPADLVCFSVPLYLRLPVRHVVSFVWTAYLSFARGGH